MDIFLKFKSIKSPFKTLISTKYYGPIHLNENFKEEVPLINLVNDFNLNINNIFLAQQIHSTNIKLIKNTDVRFSLQTDGLITHEKGIILGIVTADCLPIVLADDKTGYFGIIHGGYKGILNGIIEKAIDRFLEVGSNIKDLKIGIGPGIEGNCYDVPKERIEEFKNKYKKFPDYYKFENNKYYLDLKKLAVEILLNKNIKNGNIEIIDMCTKCSPDLLYSKRANTNTGDFITLIWKT